MKLNHIKTISTFDSLVSIVHTKLNQNKFVHFKKVNNLGFECCIGKLYNSHESNFTTYNTKNTYSYGYNVIFLNFRKKRKE